MGSIWQKTRFVLYSLLICGNTAFPAHAAGAKTKPAQPSPSTSITLPTLKPFPKGLRYEAFWKGIGVGDIAFGVDYKNGFTARAVAASSGFVSMFSAYASTTNTKGSIKDESYTPDRFHTYSYHKKKTRDIELIYGRDADQTLQVTAQNITPPENRKKRPEVPEKLRGTGLDPLTAILQGRQQIFDIIHKTPHIRSTDLRFYDGRRLSNAHIVIHGRMMREIGRHRLPVIHISITRSPVSGYTQKELKKFDEENPTFHLFLSDNFLLVPLQMKVKSEIGSIVVDIAQQCDSFATCVPQSIKDDKRLKSRLTL